MRCCARRAASCLRSRQPSCNVPLIVLATWPRASACESGRVADFLHDRRDFDQLLAVIADERGLDPMLVEKDYWIMHCLWGLQAQGFQFELKGGTSLSKGFGVIHRFSEDIDNGQWKTRIKRPTDARRTAAPGHPAPPAAHRACSDRG